jgi:hypothetical protein
MLLVDAGYSASCTNFSQAFPLGAGASVRGHFSIAHSSRRSPGTARRVQSGQTKAPRHGRPRWLGLGKLVGLTSIPRAVASGSRGALGSQGERRFGPGLIWARGRPTGGESKRCPIRAPNVATGSPRPCPPGPLSPRRSHINDQWTLMLGYRIRAGDHAHPGRADMKSAGTPRRANNSNPALMRPPDRHAAPRGSCRLRQRRARAKVLTRVGRRDRFPRGGRLRTLERSCHLVVLSGESAAGFPP